MMVADLDPQAIDDATEADRGLSGMIGSRKARLWDAYVARWQAKTRGHGATGWSMCSCNTSPNATTRRNEKR